MSRSVKKPSRRACEIRANKAAKGASPRSSENSGTTMSYMVICELFLPICMPAHSLIRMISGSTAG